MSVPEVVRERLGDEAVRERVSLGGDDELLVTPSRTLVYRAEGLLSGESVEEYTHAAERVAVTEGRRKSTIRLEHDLEGDDEFTIPSGALDDVLPPVLGGVLSTAGVTGPDEPVEAVYRLGELTIVITAARVVKHIGAVVWDEEYEEYAFENVTGLDIEEGEVSSQIIVEVDGRPQRIKTPSEDAREVRERIERALLSYHDVGSYAEFLEAVAPPDDEDDEAEAEETGAPDEPEPESEAATASGADPGGADDASDEGGMVFETGGTLDVEDAQAESTGQPVDVAREVAALREAVERQNDLLEDHQQAIEQLVEELRRGR